MNRLRNWKGQEDIFIYGRDLRRSWRERVRRNCRTETTLTPWRAAAAIRSRSRLRSSSLVTRYRELPRMAASRILSSSGSRHARRSPEIETTAARATMRRRNASTSC